MRTLAAVGAFRVVPEADLRAHPDTGSRDIRHLRELGLVETRPFVVGNTRTTLVSLTERGRELLERARSDDRQPSRQTFYAGVSKPRELAHDAQLYRAYARAAERIASRGGRVRRVVLEEELKRSYQRFLQASNRGRRDSDGRSDRKASEIAEWAHAQQLPLHEGRVQLPDVRIGSDDRDGRRAIEDVEVTTPHYRGAHATAKAQSGFTCYRSVGARVGGGGSGGRGGGRGFNPRVAEEVLE